MQNNHNKRSKRNIKTKKRKAILYAFIVIIAILVIIVIVKNVGNTEDEEVQESQTYVTEIEDGVKLNTSIKLNEAKEVDGLLITNIQLTTKSGITTLLADVINTSGVKTDLKTVEITLLNKDGEDLIDLTGIISGLEPGATTQLNISTTSDYINAYDFRITSK